MTEMDIPVIMAEVTPRIVERMNKENLSVAGNSIEHGKKLRGNLTMMIANSLGGDMDVALDYAAAIEFIHTGSLEHDDVLDGHDERRGEPTIAFMEGVQKAILSGDIMFCAANRVASENGNRAAIEVANAMQSTLDGVLKELNLDSIIRDAIAGKLEKDLYMNIVDRKTGTLFSCASKFGAMSVTDDPDVGNVAELIDLFEKFGMKLGEAYQIADDFVDIIQMSTGEKDVTPLTVIGIAPALFNYEGKLIKRIPMMAMRKNFDITSLFGLIADANIEDRMMDDIKHTTNECRAILDEIRELSSIFNGFNDGYFTVLESFPEFAVNKMLSEVGEKI